MKLTIAITALLVGCTVSPVKPLSDDLYTVTAQNYMGMSSGAHETVRALDKAEAYCRGQNQGALLKSHAEWGLPALTTLSGTIVFTCTDRANPAYVAQQVDLIAVP
jgi:hypothetical protein